MSEEQNNEVQNEHKCKCGVFKIISILALVLSICALILSVLTFTGNNITSISQQKVLISKKYDRGQSIAKAEKTKKPMLVFFYTNWCGYCQKFAPIFDKVVKTPNIKKHFAVAYVNCENEDNRKIMRNYNVEAFPSVFLVKADGSKTSLDYTIFIKDDVEEVAQDLFKTAGIDD